VTGSAALPAPGGATGGRCARRLPILPWLLALVSVAALAVACGRSADDMASQHGIQIVRFQLRSARLHRTLDEIGIAPRSLPSNRRRPLLIFLHGRGGTPESGVTAGVKMAVALGDGAPDILLANGGADSYWHDRGSGPWATSLMKELIPRAAALLHADTGHMVIGGVSMGGFGALDIARLWPDRFCGAAGHSAAIWPSAGQVNPVAFDDAADYGRHDLYGYARATRHAYPHMLIWMDVGTSDSFRPNDGQLAALLHRAGADVTFREWPGGHNSTYWSSHLAQYAAFYGRALAACGWR
jgi:enterochelin esterase-like enzyme